jgi:hypothetical protein
MPLEIRGRRTAGTRTHLEAYLLDECDPDPRGDALVQRVDYLAQDVVGLAASVQDPLDGLECAR